VLPGSQAAFIAQQVFHAAHVAAVHAVVQLTTTSRRNVAVLELADRYLGDMPKVVIEVLGLRTAARHVLISAERQRHAIHRRQIAAEMDADLVALRLTEALANVRYQLLPQKDPRIFAIVGYVPSADRCLVLPLKLVSAVDAETKQDEWWMQTAFPFGAKNFRKAKASDRLFELQVGPLPSNFGLQPPIRPRE
jgi:hypothetical protein